MNPHTSLLTPEQIDRHYRRTLKVVVISQAFGGAGLAAGLTVGVLIMEDMLGTEALSGLAVALLTLGAALAAFLVGRVTQKAGRRLALGFGFGSGGVGALGVIASTVVDSPPLFFVALFLYGAGTATNLQARYAGTDLAPAERKGTAISIAMVATTLGAVAGPNLVEPMGSVASSMGLDPLTGPFILGAAAYLIAGLILLAMLRPDPFLLAREIELLEAQNSDVEDEEVAGLAALGSRRVVLVGGLVMVISQIVMVAIMTMTPIHMRAHDHALGAVGLVIGLHVAGMWLPSLVTGLLVDKIGARLTAISSGVVLLISGFIAAFAPNDNLAGLILALVLLGVGWNLGLISGTTLVVQGTAPATRAATQGSIDVWVNIFGAGAGIFSGIMMSAAGFAALSIAGGVLALIIVPALWLAPRKPVSV